MKSKILFVCIENSNRSQMAEAFSKMMGTGIVSAYSAGSSPSGVVNNKAIIAMQELGYNLKTHHSKSLKEIEKFAPFDVLVTMGCGDNCPWIPAKKYIEWQIPDPKEMNSGDFNKVRDLIKNLVLELINSINKQSSSYQ